MGDNDISKDIAYQNNILIEFVYSECPKSRLVRFLDNYVASGLVPSVPILTKLDQFRLKMPIKL